MICFSFHDFNIYENIDKLEDHLLIVQNKKYLYNLLNDLYSGCSIHEYIKIFDENSKSLKTIDYIDFIPSLINLDINNKKNLNLFLRLIKKANMEELQKSTNDIIEIIQRTFNIIRLDAPIDIVSNITFSEDDLLKYMNILIQDDNLSLIERINSYIKITFELRNIKLFVFYGLFSLLDNDEIDLLINTCKYNNIKIIDIENNDVDSNIFSKKKILDNDNCLLENNHL